MGIKINKLWKKEQKTATNLTPGIHGPLLFSMGTANTCCPCLHADKTPVNIKYLFIFYERSIECVFSLNTVFTRTSVGMESLLCATVGRNQEEVCGRCEDQEVKGNDLQALRPTESTNCGSAGIPIVLAGTKMFA